MVRKVVVWISLQLEDVLLARRRWRHVLVHTAWRCVCSPNLQSWRCIGKISAMGIYISQERIYVSLRPTTVIYSALLYVSHCANDTLRHT